MKKVAVIEGGYSSEKAVSIKSAKTVFENLDRSKFDPTRVLIDENEWTAYDEDGIYPIDKNDFSFIKNGPKKFDYAFIVIHGTPGEDGKLQGYFDMIISHTTPQQRPSLLSLFKNFIAIAIDTHLGFVAKAVSIKKEDHINNQEILNRVGLPAL